MRLLIRSDHYEFWLTSVGIDRPIYIAHSNLAHKHDNTGKITHVLVSLGHHHDHLNTRYWQRIMRTTVHYF